MRASGCRSFPIGYWFFGCWLSVCTLVSILAWTARAWCSSDVRQTYAGTFRFTGGAKERAALEHAIDDVTEGVSWIERPFVRRKLEKCTQIAPWVTFSFPPGMISMKVPGLAPAVSPDTGAEVDYWHDGEKLRLRQRFDGGQLVQSFRANDGTRLTLYVPASADSTLVLDVTLKSPHLPKVLHYELSYRR